MGLSSATPRACQDSLHSRWCSHPRHGRVATRHSHLELFFFYLHTIDPLLAAGDQVLAPDLLGHGFSDRRDRFDRSFQDQARIIVRLLRKLKHDEDPVHAVGRDTASVMALIFVIEKTEKIKLCRMISTNLFCYARFDDDMLDFNGRKRQLEI